MKNDAQQIKMKEVSMKEKYKSIIESVLFVTGDGISIKNLSLVLEISIDKCMKIILELEQEYKESNRGIKLIKDKERIQLVTKPENSIYIEKLFKSNTKQNLSQAALETLAIIAYKQPITRIAVDEIRGVKSERAISTLVEKNIIKECGRLNVIGRPILYSTTDEFLKYFGLDSVNDMPNLEELLIQFENDWEKDKK